LSSAVKHRRAPWDRLLISVAALALALGAARAQAASDQRELKAREEFAAGRFQQALDIFAKLYAETLHPVYLRNIGRCYQNLGDPDKAIISFREYLRKQKTIKPDERAEVEGFIAEMEALKKERSGGASATAAPVPTPEPTPPKAESAVKPLPAAPEPKTGGAAPEALVTAPAAPARDESPPIYARWWFWTLVGAAAVGAGLGIAAATGAFTTTKDASCAGHPDYDCQ
jgi:tetratricopeptide (TPR) repeat protein